MTDTHSVREGLVTLQIILYFDLSVSLSNAEEVRSWEVTYDLIFDTTLQTNKRQLKYNISPNIKWRFLQALQHPNSAKEYFQFQNNNFTQIDDFSDITDISTCTPFILPFT